MFDPELFRKLRQELDKVISGYSDIKDKIIIALFADGHVLLESVPGLAKTTMISAFQAAIDGSVRSRVQMTPDKQPADILGNLVYNPKEGRFEINHGPLHGANLVLVDEINRGTPKTQSALLESMQERKLTMGTYTFNLPSLFLVLATMNPIEQEGTYPLPEAQLDRFCFKLSMGYVSRKEELEVLKNTTVHGREPQRLITPVVTVDQVLAARNEILNNVVVSQEALEYIVDLVRTSRPGDKHFPKSLHGQVQLGASPRAEIWLLRTSQVLAASKGRTYVVPEDIKELAPDVLRHRIILSPEATLDDSSFSIDAVIDEILKTVDIIRGK
jgi:MoxR-like ATPase